MTSRQALKRCGEQLAVCWCSIFGLRNPLANTPDAASHFFVGAGAHMQALQNFAGLMGIVAVVATALAFGADGFSPWEIWAIAVLFVGACIAAVIAANPRILVVIFQFDNDVYRLERAQQRDIPAMHAIAVNQFGRNVTPQSQMRGMLKRNKQVFWVLVCSKQRQFSTSVQGYLCLLPMSEDMVSKADRHEFDVTLIHPPHLPRPSDAAEAVYIGAVVGRTPRAKGQALGHLLEKAASLAQQTRLKMVYARAASADGLRLITKHEFMPVLPERTGVGCLYRRGFDADEA